MGYDPTFARKSFKPLIASFKSDFVSLAFFKRETSRRSISFQYFRKEPPTVLRKELYFIFVTKVVSDDVL